MHLKVYNLDRYFWTSW